MFRALFLHLGLHVPLEFVCRSVTCCHCSWHWRRRRQVRVIPQHGNTREAVMSQSFLIRRHRFQSSLYVASCAGARNVRRIHI